jgi:DNA-binding IscR family transcriptional regulator
MLISIDLKEGIISSTIGEQKGYEINMRTGQINVSDILATTISGAIISGGTWQKFENS